ncbi:MAG: efflux RND transporter permease subunit [Patescibacteria group bacterium]|nr:efflux RND transporter permease subunit [Patescibacteria group bacterium]
MDQTPMDQNNQPVTPFQSESNPAEKQNVSSDHLYLESLTFDPKLRKSWLNFFVSNFRVVILIIILLTGWGIYSFASLPRESNPEVKIPIAVVVTTYPGASPADMEELVTKKIETSIAGLKGISKITSNSANSVSSIRVEFDSSVNLDDAMRSLRDQVNDSKKNLPADANDPSVMAVSLDDSPIWIASFSSPVDGFTLRKEADDIKDELEKIPGVRQVNISGGDQREFEIAYDPQKLTYYNLSPDQANQLVKAANLAVPAGSFEGQKYSFPVRADGRFWTDEALGNLPLLHTDDGAQVLLRDIATVKENAIEKTVFSRYAHDGQTSQENVTIQVVKKTGGNIIQTVGEVQSKMDEMVGKMPKGTSYGVIVSYADQINSDFSHLIRDFLLTIILVALVLFLIVGFKEAFVAGLAVPLVFFATFGVMGLIGVTLNFLSMFSLILALGLLVDDAIVVVSATKQYMNTGKFTPEEAVLLVLNDFKVVLTTTTLTTVWAFLPLLVSTGIIGEFIKSIPITVSTTLIASLFIALFINHPLAAVLERIRLTKNFFFVILSGLALLALGLGMVAFPYGLAIAVIPTVALGILLRWYMRGGKGRLEGNQRLSEAEWRDDDLIKQKLKSQANGHESGFWTKLMHGIVNFDRLVPVYEKYLRKILATKRTRWMTLGSIFLLFCAAVALPLTGAVQSEFFPRTDSDTISISIEAPTGLKLDETDGIVRKVEGKLLSYPEISSYSAIIGNGGAGSQLSTGSSNSSNLANITIKLKDSSERKRRSFEISDAMQKDFNNIREATITASAQSMGPPAGSDFEAQISGDDLQELDKIAQELKPELASINGVVNPQISLKMAPADYTFMLDPARLELYNLNAAYVGSVLRTAIAGTEVTTVILDGQEVPVTARFDKTKIPNLEAIQNIQILNNAKQPVFLKDVATIQLEPSVDAITRIDKKRTTVLTASVNGANKPANVVKEFQDRVARNHKLPEGYSINYGGQNEQNTESVTSILKAMIIAVLLIISTLVIQFNSFRKSLIVLVTIPLGLIGVFFGLALTGITLSFPGLIGIVALFGIVVKNAIILVDKINLNLKSGIPFTESIVDAGKSRLEAIFITSICTILGMIPITLSNATWTALGSAVIFGLILSSFFTLFIVPTLFMTFVKDNARRNDGPVNEPEPSRATL